jgi:hypothetical protein
MNSLENFHIYNVSKNGLQLHEAYSGLTNPIYDVLIKTHN